MRVTLEAHFLMLDECFIESQSEEEVNNAVDVQQPLNGLVELVCRSMNLRDAQGQ